MTQRDNDIAEELKCPICGKIATKGCIYGADSNALRWIEGDPSLLKNLKTGIGIGKIIGESPLLKGSHIKGICCASCNKIVVDM